MNHAKKDTSAGSLSSILTNMIAQTSFDAKTKSLSVALMLVLFLAAMETTVTVLATPSITRDLAGFDIMSLIFSAYLFMSAITTPIFGFFADTFGRKRTLIIGILVFLVGSALCGFSQSMIMLVASRAVQGIGSGAIFTLSYTIVGDVFPLESRGPIMGAMSSMWGIAGLAGPLLGGLLIDAFSWHWVFFINIPFGILSIVLVQISLKETHGTPPKEQKHSDKSGLFTRATVLVNAVAFLASISMIGIDVYLALFLQSVLGYSPTISGLAVFPMAISWFFVSLYMGKLLMRFNPKILVVICGCIQVLCSVLLISLNAESGLLAVILCSFFCGIGIGGLITSATMIIQESVSYSKRGSAMGINTFVKSMGQTVGISVLGAALNIWLISFFAKRGYSEIDPSGLMQGGGAIASGSDSLSSLSDELIIQALDGGIDFLFWILLLSTILLVLLALFIPKVKLQELN